MFRFRLTIDRLVTQEELQKLVSALTFLKEGDTLSITQGESKEKPFIKPFPSPVPPEEPLTNVIPEERPHLPTTVSVKVPKEQLLLPDIVEKPSATPKTDKLIERAKDRTRISRAEKVNSAITRLSEIFPEYADSLDLLFTQLDWSSHKDTWRLYSVEELSDFIVIPKEDINKVMSRFCTLSCGDVRSFYDDQILLPKTFDDIANEEKAKREEIEKINIQKTGDPHIGPGVKIVENKGVLTEVQFLKLLEKLNWEDTKKYSALTNYEFFNYFNIKEDMRNSMALIRAIKKYHPEWELKPYYVTTQYGISRIVNRFPLPKEPDPNHPFPKGR